MSDAVKIEVEHLTDLLADPLVLTDGDWISYECTSDLWQDADDFSVSLVPTKEALDFFRRPGHKIRIYAGDALQFTGIIDACPVSAGEGGLSLQITGRDYGGILIDAAAPMITYANQSLKQLAERLVAPWGDYITQVVTTNDANRYKVAGYSRADLKSASAKTVSAESKRKLAAIKAGYAPNAGTRFSGYRGITQERQYKWRSKPGDRVLDIIKKFAQDIACAVWMTHKGELCIARPDYDSPPVADLFVNIDNSGNVTDSNCRISVSSDIGDRHSETIVVGQGTPSATALGKDLAEKYSKTFDPSDSFWIYDGGAFQPRLRKYQIETVRNVKDVKVTRRLARTKMEKAVCESYDMTIEVRGHRSINGLGPLWHPDSIVDVSFQPKGIVGPHYVVGRTFHYDKDNGRTTSLKVIPSDIWLALDHDFVSDSAYAANLRSLWDKYAL